MKELCLQFTYMYNVYIKLYSLNCVINHSQKLIFTRRERSLRENTSMSFYLLLAMDGLCPSQNDWLTDWLSVNHSFISINFVYTQQYKLNIKSNHRKLKPFIIFIAYWRCRKSQKHHIPRPAAGTRMSLGFMLIIDSFAIL